MANAKQCKPQAGTGSELERQVGLVLCGGNSRRMGRDKAELQLDGQSLLERACSVLEPGLEEVVLAVGPKRRSASGRHQVLDHRHSAGPLAGLEAGLAEVNARHGDAWVFVLACDMPWASRELFNPLLQEARAQAADVALYTSGGMDEPLFAVYHTRLLGAVTAALDSGRRRLVSLFDQHACLAAGESPRQPRVVRLVLANPGSVCSVNTPEEFARECNREHSPPGPLCHGQDSGPIEVSA